MKRRDFLKFTALGGMYVLGSSGLGSTRALAGEGSGTVWDKPLLLVELNGGNDGLNTVVPFRDEAYKQNRQRLFLDPGRLISLDDSTGLHPAMRSAGKLLERRELSIVPGVGYPNPSRSHFRSMAVWHSAHRDHLQHSGPGWIGRALDQSPRGQGMDSMHVGAAQPVPALNGRRSVASTLDRIEDFELDRATASGRALASGESDDHLEAFVRRSTLDAYTTADQLTELNASSAKVGRFPQTNLGRRFSQIANLIRGDVGARVYYVVHPGFDTHAGQAEVHSALLRELADALLSFSDSLHKSGHADQTLVMCFSEFGRRVAENGGQGTDHGVAGPVILSGTMVKAGCIGDHPSLTDLTNGDLKVGTDFRSVYATILKNWLGLDPVKALGQEYPLLPLFA